MTHEQPPNEEEIEEISQLHERQEEEDEKKLLEDLNLLPELANASDSEITDCKFESEPYDPANLIYADPPYTEENVPKWSKVKATIKGHSVEFSEELKNGEDLASFVYIDNVELYDYTGRMTRDRQHIIQSLKDRVLKILDREKSEK